MRHTIVAAILLASLGSAVFAAGTTAKNDDQLRAEPSPGAAVLAPVAADTALEVLERRGFWAKVRTSQGTGWLRLSSLNLQERPTEGGSTLSALGGLATGRTGSGNIVAVAGTRGLSAGDLRAARPDYDALAQVKLWAVTPALAESYAGAGGLAPRSVTYLTASPAAPR